MVIYLYNAHYSIIHNENTIGYASLFYACYDCDSKFLKIRYDFKKSNIPIHSITEKMSSH